MRGLPIGYSQDWKRMRYEVRKRGGKQPGESSGILFGPVRSGKGTDVIVPMLLEYEGSIICLDPKGQNACITAEHRRRRLKQNVVLLNPLREWPELLGSFSHAGMNPLLNLDADYGGFGIDCDAIGESIVPDKPRDPDSHFTDGGQQVVSGTVMVVAREANSCEKKPFKCL